MYNARWLYTPWLMTNELCLFCSKNDRSLKTLMWAFTVTDIQIFPSHNITYHCMRSYFINSFTLIVWMYCSLLFFDWLFNGNHLVTSVIFYSLKMCTNYWMPSNMDLMYTKMCCFILTKSNLWHVKDCLIIHWQLGHSLHLTSHNLPNMPK